MTLRVSKFSELHIRLMYEAIVGFGVVEWDPKGIIVKESQQTSRQFAS